MTDGESKGDRISRRAILVSLPVSALAGGFAAGGIASALASHRLPVAVGGATPAPTATPSPTATPAPPSKPRPSTGDAAPGIVGDGSTDNASALNALLANAQQGDDIVLPAGEYLIESVLRLQSGVNLIGAGAGVTTVRLADNSQSPFVLASGMTQVRVSGITFDGGIQDQDAVSLQFDGCSDVVVENCAFIRMSHAVHVYTTAFESSERIVIRGNYFSQISDYAVRVTEGTETVLIEDNVVADVAKKNATSPAAFYIRGVDVTVTGNTVLGSDDTAVLVAGTTTRNVAVVGNRLHTTLVCVFFGSGATEGSIVGNTLLSDLDFGVHLFDRNGGSSRTVVAQNHLIATGKSGVQVEGVSDFVISSNLIFDPGTRSGMKTEWCCGITLTRTDGGSASQFSVIGNLIASDSSDSQMEHAILVSVEAKHVQIASNTWRGARSDSVMLKKKLDAPFSVETEDEIISSRTLRTV
ncbi:glycosyl hydrolase family 28-related protein [Herbiconiux sp.]|uniref:glycosyl hydrolase family 28-related protein n=1 Tax=Herbiconiux sp. TaxID=1871186 RepID=UPI0025BFBC07|nr:glycosyl hydrolase family 28-related protein [Herbiconiux sp.]